jgi:hypothetical protein
MRARARLIVGQISLLVFLASLVLPNFANRHLATADDPDCGILAVTAHRQATFETPADDAKAPEHCAVCHWLRSLRNTAPTPVMRPAPDFISAVAVTPQLPQAAGYTPTFDAPSRAPPAATLL